MPGGCIELADYVSLELHPWQVRFIAGDPGLRLSPVMNVKSIVLWYRFLSLNRVATLTGFLSPPEKIQIQSTFVNNLLQCLRLIAKAQRRFLRFSLVVMRHLISHETKTKRRESEQERERERENIRLLILVGGMRGF